MSLNTEQIEFVQEKLEIMELTGRAHLVEGVYVIPVGGFTGPVQRNIAGVLEREGLRVAVFHHANQILVHSASDPQGEPKEPDSPFTAGELELAYYEACEGGSPMSWTTWDFFANILNRRLGR